MIQNAIIRSSGNNPHPWSLQMTRTFTVANIQNVYTTTLLDQFQMLDAQRTFSPVQDVVDASIEIMNKIAEELDRREGLF